MTYELFYWPGLPGRGEFIRLALEDAGAPYVDVAREAGGMPKLLAMLKNQSAAFVPFAPPFLRDGDLVISHVANILQHLGPKLGLAPDDEAGRLAAHAYQLSITDFVKEVHDTHHPIASGLYYEDQKAEAKAYAKAFLDERVPKFMGYFEAALARNPVGSAQLVGSRIGTVDLSLFQIVEGMKYAFPRAMKGFDERFPKIAHLGATVRKRERLARYLESARRIPFNETGIFRHYPELDRDPLFQADRTQRSSSQATASGASRSARSISRARASGSAVPYVRA